MTCPEVPNVLVRLKIHAEVPVSEVNPAPATCIDQFEWEGAGLKWGGGCLHNVAENQKDTGSNKSEGACK